MSPTRIIHLRPDKICKDGVQDYQENLIHSLCDYDKLSAQSNRIQFLELKLWQLLFYWSPAKEQSLIHCQLPMRAWRFNLFLPLILWLKLISKKYKLIITLHEWSNTHPLRRIINYILLRKSMVIIVPSEELRKEILEFNFVAKKKIVIEVIPIGPNIILKDTQKYANEQKNNNEKTTCLIGHFGFLYQLKNPIKVLKVFSELKKNNKDVKLIFIGDFLDHSSKEKQKFSGLISELKLKESTQFLGYLEDETDVINEMQKWDLYISLHEKGFSLRHGSTLAALQLGIPVISYEPLNMFSEFEKRWLEIIIKDQNLILIKKELTIPEISDIIALNLNPGRIRSIKSLSWIWEEIAKMHFSLYNRPIN